MMNYIDIDINSPNVCVCPFLPLLKIQPNHETKRKKRNNTHNKVGGRRRKKGGGRGFPFSVYTYFTADVNDSVSFPPFLKKTDQNSALLRYPLIQICHGDYPPYTRPETEEKNCCPS